MKNRILLALPCFNEAENIPKIIEKVRRINKTTNFFIKTYVIDDASTDNTQEVLKKLKDEDIVCIRHDVNRGLTGGINTAIRLFYEDTKQADPYNAYVIMDGDDSHSPFQILEQYQEVCKGFDVVVASRYRDDSRTIGVSRLRQLFSIVLGLLFKIMRNIPGVRDYSCGFRMYSPAIVKKLGEEYDDGDFVLEQSFASMVELLVRCHLEGALFREIPMVLRYDLKLGQSKMNFKKTILGNLKLLLITKRTVKIKRKRKKLPL